MHCYCNNKSLSILAALFVANFVFGCGRVKEGFEEAMKAPGDLLKDAAEAAAQAGGQLAKEGNATMVDKCSDLAISAATTAQDCEQPNRTKDGKADGDACEFKDAIAARCMKNDAVVTKLADGKTDTDQNNCVGDVGTWEAAKEAQCV